VRYGGKKFDFPLDREPGGEVYGMQTSYAFYATTLTLLFTLSNSPSVRAGTKWVSGIEAQRVLGQIDFISAESENSISRIRFPEAIAIDPTTGKLFIADTGNNRILRFGSYDAFLNGSAAEAVVGQSTFEATGGRNGQDGLFTPSGIFIDDAGRLWVADRNNSRILRYENASSLDSGPLADGVLGTTSYGITGAGTSQSRVWQPIAVAGDEAGNLFVVDLLNHRVLMWSDAANLADGADAALVLGQEDFTSMGHATRQGNFFYPGGIALDLAGNLYVADTANNRVMRFDNAASKNNGDDADVVFGQTAFNTSLAGDGPAGLSAPRGLAFGAGGRLWVGDSGNGRVMVFENPATAMSGVAAAFVLGRPDFSTTAPVIVSASRLESPYGIHAAPDESVFVADRGHHRVLVFEEGQFLPDLTIGTKGKSQRGSFLMNASGAGQLQSIKVKGREAIYSTSLINRGTVSDQFIVRSQKPTSKFDVTVFRVSGGRANVSASTKAGVHRTAAAVRGGSISYEMRVKAAKSSVKKRGNYKAYLEGRSAADGTPDRVLSLTKNRP